jgi:2-polyprenyl-6-methoxyphenol hydroxylase-like FAD-dependent oxidoreductase
MHPPQPMSLPEHTEVVIVGAGPSGLATALALASHGVPFVILDALREGQGEDRAVAVHAYSLEV